MKLLTIGEFAEKMGVDPDTVRRWDREGKIVSERTKGGHRRFPESELYKVENKQEEKYTVCYGRVSTKNKEDDLQRQKQVMEMYCASKGYDYTTIEDIGSGLNYKKPGLLKLIDLIEGDRIDRLILVHKNRLLRFGSEMIFHLCKFHNVEVEIINKDENTDFEQELVDDVLSVITVFSAKLYGSRSNKNKQIVEKNKEFFKNENG